MAADAVLPAAVLNVHAMTSLSLRTVILSADVAMMGAWFDVKHKHERHTSAM